MKLLKMSLVDYLRPFWIKKIEINRMFRWSAFVIDLVLISQFQTLESKLFMSY